MNGKVPLFLVVRNAVSFPSVLFFGYDKMKKRVYVCTLGISPAPAFVADWQIGRLADWQIFRQMCINLINVCSTYAS